MSPRGRALVLLAAAAFAGARPARAAAPALTWEACVAEAERANPDLAASRFTLESGRAAMYQSWNGLMPQVTLSNSLSEAKTMPSDRWSAQASASITLLDAGQIAAIRAASAVVGLDEASVRKASADVRYGLRVAYAHVLFAQRDLEVARSVRDIRARDAEMVTLRYKSGTESKGNMLRAQAQSLEARLAVDQAERELGTARRELAQRLGRDDFADFTATGTFAAAAAPPRPSDLTDLLPLRPDVLVAEAQVRESRAAIAKSESSLWPSLSAVYSRSRGDGAEFPSARYSWAAGATLKYALFGGGPTSTWYGIKSSRRAFDAAKAGLDSVRQAALTDLQTAWAAYADAVDQVRVQGELLAAARQRNGEADIRYASGLLSYDNWEVIVSDRVSTESRAVAALRTAMNAEAAWYRALGRALGE